MGTICSKGPRGSFAPLAFEHLKVAVQLAETKFAHQPRAKPGLVRNLHISLTLRANACAKLTPFKPLLKKRQQAAHQAIAAIGPGPTSSISSSVQQARGRSQQPSRTQKEAS